MRIDVWTVVRFVHVISAVIWVGGQLTLSLFVRPVVAGRDHEGWREVFIAVGSRFARFSTWILFPALLATGLALSYHRGVEYGAFRLPGYGTLLGVKVVLAMASFALAGVHGYLASRQSPGPSRVVGISGVVLSVAVVLLATALVL